MEDGAVVERDAVLLGVRDGIGPVFGALARPMKLATPMGASSGNSVQVSLPAVVSMMAVGRARCGVPRGGRLVRGLRPCGAVWAAGAVCDHPAEHAAAISKQIEKHFLMDAPERRAMPGWTGEGTRPYVICGDCEI